LLARRLIIYPYDVGVGDFVKRYLATHAAVNRTFEVDEDVLNEFRLESRLDQAAHQEGSHYLPFRAGRRAPRCRGRRPASPAGYRVDG
jgi:hypothetical protein